MGSVAPRKTIVTNMAVIACDVCGRTLLRGENADVFLHGGSRRTVCELCTTRAMHEGWIREGVDDTLSGRRSGERGGSARSLLGRLRSRRSERGYDDAPDAAPAYDPASYDPDHYASGYVEEVPTYADGTLVLPDPEPEPAPVAPPEPVVVTPAPPHRPAAAPVA
ncbi:MAG: hypothetical protein JWM31_2438, partial [Solirubrobacterales bacterium]|nr:hypothetical protein [Solirubrobacterales bacterium]